MAFKMNKWSAFTKPDPAETARKKVVENVNEEIEYGTTGKKGLKRVNPRNVAWKEARKKFGSKINKLLTFGRGNK